MQSSYANVNNKIWILRTNNSNITIPCDSEKQVTCYVNHTISGMNFHISLVYAKCKTNMRRDVWEDLLSISKNIQGPWSIVGGFECNC